MLVKGIRERGWMIMNGGIKGDTEAGWTWGKGKSRSYIIYWGKKR